MICGGRSKATELPEGLIGVSFDDDRGFVGADCLEDREYQKSTEKEATPIFADDAWFPGDLCSRCKRLVERP